jgi:hypothetical protein
MPTHTPVAPATTQPTQQAKLQAMQELHKVARDSRVVLAKATAVFPITLFPGTVAVDRSQVSITKRTFFLAGDVTSIQVDDILNVTAVVGPLFGKVRIATRYFDPDKPYDVDHFWRDDALRIAAIINGLVVAKANNIDISALSGNELVETLKRVGQSPVDTQP